MTEDSATIVATPIYSEWGPRVLVKGIAIGILFYSPYLKVFKILCGVSCSASEKYVLRHPTAPVTHDTPTLTTFNDNQWSDSQRFADWCVLF